jgi:hypothetical protein
MVPALSQPEPKSAQIWDKVHSPVKLGQRFRIACADLALNQNDLVKHGLGKRDDAHKGNAA